MGRFGILTIPEWMIRFAYLNFLWICFSLLGLGILGFFPATTAMFAVIRKWLLGASDTPIFKTFWSIYKKEFLRSNILGLILLITGCTLYVDLHFLKQSSNIVLQILAYFVYMITFICLLTSLYVFPVFVHYENTIGKILKTAFLIMIVSPLSTMMMIAGSILFYFLMTNFIGLIPFVGGSLLAFVIMWSASLTFSRIEYKKAAVSNGAIDHTNG